MFLIIAIGYLAGSIKVKGLQLGTSAILLVALVFGHFGFEAPGLVRQLGLITFVTSIGFIAGPTFIQNFRSKMHNYIILGFMIVLSGALLCVLMIAGLHIPVPLGIGMLAGALTSTPGLAAAIEATGDSIASIGYGIAYPFGVVGVVLFIQLVPSLVKADMKQEAALLEVRVVQKSTIEEIPFVNIGSLGLFNFSLAVIIGLLIAAIRIPLFGGASFSLGSSGGPLLAGLLLGHIGSVGKVDLKVPKSTLNLMREFGLALFLLGAGTQAGHGFTKVLKEYGVLLFFAGAVMTTVPMLLGYFVARKLMKIELLNCLGAICGGMTSTPALGTLVSVSGSDLVATAYAATYPIALISIILSCQLLAIYF